MTRLSCRTIALGLMLCLAVVGLAMWTGLIHTPDFIAQLAANLTPESIGGISLAPMPLITKDPRATEFRAQAEALQAQLFDPANKMEPAEVDKRTAEIKALMQRAQMIAEFTPEAEITRKGGDAELKLRAPESTDEITTTPLAQAKELRGNIIREFGGMREYVKAVVGRTVRGDLTDKQRAILAATEPLTRTIVGTASDPSGGEYLLPLQQEPSIFVVPNLQNGIIAYARRYSVAGRSLRIPYLVQTAATGASGVTVLPMAGGIADVSIVGEGGTKPTREPTFNQRLLTIFKWAAYSEFGDEVLGDDFTGDLQKSVMDVIGGQVMNAMDDKMLVSGSGTGEPLGALHANNAALLSFNRTTTGTIVVGDLFKMMSRHTMGPNSYWCASRRVIEALMALTLSGNTLVTWIPNLRDGVAQGGQIPFLFGMPVRLNDLQPTLGQKGDFALINPDFYGVGLRQQVTIDTSQHYKFPQDLTSVRFLARGGGIPIPDGTYAYKAVGTTKVDEHSPFVCLNGN